MSDWMPVRPIDVVRTATCVCLCVASAFVPSALLSAALALAAVIILNYVALSDIVRSRVISRTLRSIPYLMPVFSTGLPELTSISPWSYLVCLGVVGLWFVSSYRNFRINYRIAPLLDPVSRSERAAGILPHLLAGPAQEFLHRGVLLIALVDLIGPFAILISTVTFVAEHIFTCHMQPSRRELAVWSTLGLAFGISVFFDHDAVWVAIVAHMAFNFPLVLVWLRTPGKRPMTQEVSERA